MFGDKESVKSVLRYNDHSSKTWLTIAPHLITVQAALKFIQVFYSFALELSNAITELKFIHILNTFILKLTTKIIKVYTERMKPFK